MPVVRLFAQAREAAGTATDVVAGDTVAAVLDNEPMHVNDYRRSFPEALVVHLATDHSMRDTLVDPGIPSIADFGSWS